MGFFSHFFVDTFLNLQLPNTILSLSDERKFGNHCATMLGHPGCEFGNHCATMLGRPGCEFGKHHSCAQTATVGHPVVVLICCWAAHGVLRATKHTQYNRIFFRLVLFKVFMTKGTNL